MKAKKIKNTLLVVLTLALVAAASVAVTLALVSANLGEQTNTFTNSPDIDVGISEDKWDDQDVNGSTHSSTTATLGQTLAQSYSTGMVIPKNPSLTNTSTTVTDVDRDEWVAMTVTYQIDLTGLTVYSDANGTTFNVANMSDNQKTYSGYTAFSSALAHVGTAYNATTGAFTEGFNLGTSSTNWTAKDTTTNTVFYYNSELSIDAQTSELFSYVKINDNFTTANVTVGSETKTCYAITLGDGSVVYTEDLPKFKITLKGYAVQADGVDNDAAKDALDALILGN